MSAHNLSFTVILERRGVISRVTVPAKAQGMTGHWHGDTPYAPDLDALAAAMPQQLRAAILRRGVFWTLRDDPNMPQRMDIFSITGRAMGTLFAFPDWIKEATDGSAPAHWKGLYWTTFKSLDIGQHFYAAADGCRYVKHTARSARMTSHGSAVYPFARYDSVNPITRP